MTRWEGVGTGATAENAFIYRFQSTEVFPGASRYLVVKSGWQCILTA